MVCGNEKRLLRTLECIFDERKGDFMRCNQVSISIERFGKYVPEEYPADVQRIDVYCDDYKSIYAALSKAYALVINELNEYEQIGVSADVSTNEFSHVNYREMHDTIPILKSKYEDDVYDVNWQYLRRRLELCNDYVWLYEHSDELLEAIKDCKESADFVLILKERFGLNDVQIRKISQIRLDMLTQERYENTKKEVEKMKRKMEKRGNQEDNKLEWSIYLKEKINSAKQEIEALEAYFVTADHYEEIFKIMMEAETLEDFMKFMKERFGFSYGQSRAVRYYSVNDFSREERIKKESRIKKLKEDCKRYEKWLEECLEEYKKRSDNS